MPFFSDSRSSFLSRKRFQQRRARRGRRRRFEQLEYRRLLAVTPTGDEQLVNDVVARAQRTTLGAQAVAIQPNGEFLVTYEGAGAGDANGVFARLFAADGTPEGNALLVNTTRRGIQRSASVAALENGNYAIVWSGRGQGDRSGVFARVFDAQGMPLTGEILVNVTRPGSQRLPQITAWSDPETENAGFAVAWSGFGPGDFEGVFLRVFDTAGNALSGETRVNQTVVSRQDFPSIAMAGSDLVVAWSSFGQDGSGWGVYARRFGTDGTARGDEMIVNDVTLGDQLISNVAGTDDGAFVVSYSSRDGQSGMFDFFAQRFAATDAPQGGRQRINQQLPLDQAPGQIVMSADGGYLATWMSELGDGSGLAVMARQFAADGTPLGQEFVVSQTTLADQRFPSVAQNAAGQAVIAWSGFGAGDPQGVYVRRFALDQTPEMVNNPPDLAPINDQQTQPGVAVELTATATDPDGDNLTYVLDDSAPEGATIDPDTGAFQWTPTAQQTGTFTITVIVVDNGQPALSDTESFTVTVGPNNPPDLAPIDDQQTQPGVAVELTATATDPDGDNLTYVLDDSAPEGATIDPDTGAFQWTPTAEQTGTFTITVIVVDNGQPALSDTESFTVTVGPNNPPDLAPINDQQTQPGVAVELTATATDPDGNDLTYLLDDSAPEGATIDPDTGAFQWTPTAEQTGTFIITVIVVDNGSPAMADTESFTVDVASAPEAVDDSATTSLNAPVVIDVVANDVDADGTVDPTTVMIVADATNGSTAVDPVTGQVTYTPDDGFFGSDTFTYTVEDNDGLLSNVATVTIEVQAPPLAVDDSALVTQNDSVVIDVTANDVDPDGTIDPATVTIVADAANGSTAVNAVTGQVLYTPNVDFFGDDLFTYTVSDNDGNLSNVATVSVRVNAPPVISDAITINLNDVEVDPLGTISIDLLQNATDPDGTIDPTSVEIESFPASGQPLVLGANGTAVYTVPSAVPPTFADTFSYTVRDNDGAVSNIGQVLIFALSIPASPASAAVADGSDSPSSGDGSPSDATPSWEDLIDLFFSST